MSQGVNYMMTAISENTRLKIGELAQQTGVAVGTLRYYEGLGLLHPIKRGDNGYRYYSPNAVQQVQFIKKAQVLGFSLEEIRKVADVRDRGEPPCDLVKVLLDSKIDQFEAKIEQMTAFKAELEDYRNTWTSMFPEQLDGPEVCPLIDSVPLMA